MKNSRLKSIAISAALAVMAGAMAVVCWRIEMFPLLHAAFILSPRLAGEQLVAPPLAVGAGLIISMTLAAGLIMNRLTLRDASPYLGATFLVLTIVSLVGSRFLALDTLCFPTLFGSVAAALGIHIVRLGSIDRELSSLLFQLATTTPGGAASSKLASGLKLLGTELPLNEAIAFQLSNNCFTPVARLRMPHRSAGDNSPNSAWRKAINLCERATTTREIVTQQDQNNSKLTNVAVPLGHKTHIVGALLIRLDSGLRTEDQLLLKAVAAQLARNLAHENFSRSSPRRRLLSYFSARATRTKLAALHVVNGLLTEQRCGTNVLAQVNEGVAIAYLDGTLAFVNPELQRFANLSNEKVRTLNLFELLDRFRTGAFDEPAIAVRRVLQSGEPYECELTFPEQNTILGLRIALLHDSLLTQYTGEPLCLAVYVRDLTRLKDYEQLKSDMISLMSHELRTPLTSINGFAELLAAEESLPEQTREFVTIIASESQRLSRMINTFLAVTRLERRDKQEVLKIPLKLNDVVKETIMSLQPVAKKKRIRLIDQPAQKLPPVAADKSLITQAVKNLVNNAIKYSPERTTVTISTLLEAEAVRLLVEDRGFGIPPESRDRVWEKFYRVVREGQEKDEESTGLGLSFVREVVEQHGGNVELESEEGRGSKFSFTLPRL